MNNSLYESILHFVPGSYQFITPSGKWIFIEFQTNGSGTIVAKNSNAKDSPNIAYFAYNGSRTKDLKLGYLEVKKKSASVLFLEGVHDRRYHDASMMEIKGSLEFDKQGIKLIHVNLEFTHTSAGMRHDPQKAIEIIR